MRRILLDRLGLCVSLIFLAGSSSLSLQHADAQTVNITPKLIPFPNQATGTSSPSVTVTLTNTEPAAIAISGIQIAAPFSQSNNCPPSLATGQSCTFNIAFSPTAVQYYSSTMTVTDSSPNSPQTVTLTGNGVVPVTYTPKLIPFPNEAVGGSSAPVPITVTNNQSTPITISSIGLGAPFSQTNNCGASLAAGQSCTFNVVFSPTAVKYYTATLTVANSSALSPLSVSLTGNGFIPVTVSPALISFPTQGVGATSSPIAVTVTNKQSIALGVSNIQTAAPFAQTNNCGASIAAGQSCTVNVTFDPTAVQYYTGSLTIADDAPGSPQAVSLGGSGAGSVTYTPKLISFPDQGIGGVSAPVAVTLSNNQATPMSISSVQLPAPFTQTNNCGASLAAGTSCTFNVTFSPTTVKYYSGTMTITDNASGSPQTVALGGNGIVPVSFTPKVGGLYFNNQIELTPSTPQPVTITNNQPLALTVTSIASTADYPFTTNCGLTAAGGTLAAGATCTIAISFDPQAIGKRTTNMVISYSVPGGPITIPLQGSGIAGTPPDTVRVTPATACILPSETEQYYADVLGQTNQSVKWYVDGKLNGNATVGTITPTGLYSAPAAAGSHTVRAVSQAVTTMGGSVAINVTETPGFGIYPYVSSIPIGAQQAFQAQMCSYPDPGTVTFTVDGIAGGNATVGTITSDGVYTAPTKAGKHTIRVADAALGKSSGGVVNVFYAISADFGSRTFTNYPVPANMFGTGRGEAMPTTSARQLLTQGGLTETRLYAQIPQVYATTTPEWSKVDSFISTIQAAGQHALLQMSQSPPWLQPTTGTCKGNAVAAPTDINQWAQIAAAYVAHMDSKFPGVVPDYEIWNEPNAASLCTGDHLNTYLAIYAAAAAAMKAQAAQDGVTIRIGGPAVSGYTSTWFSNLLTNPATAPYVDFLSYHQYFFGSTQLQAQWDAVNGNPSLYEATQDTSNGVFANYKKVLGQLAAGQQPGGANTPVFVTEYNTNWAFYQDCCRNDATYGPLWNALYVTDMLDSVYNGAPQVPNKLFYFAGSAYPWFCMIGVPDANMDCLYSAGATPSPYPQYYTYQLIASSQYLGLAGGGYMAKSISTPTGGGGLATTAFYTPALDAVVISNPTGTDYPQIRITLANSGYTATQGTLYTIQNGANGTEINSSPVSLSAQGQSLTATISVPAYSVQAIAVK